MPKGVHGFRGKASTCHPERKNYGKGLCRQCYDAQWYIKVVKKIRRDLNLKRYGIDEEKYQEILTAQNHKCAICGADKPGNGERIKYLHVDHDHSTGEIRGLLCGPCNRGIGLLKDSPDLLQKALEYLNGANKHAIGDVKR